jgi:hypothetical protein
MFVSRYCSEESRESVRQLLSTDLSDYEIARRTGVSRGTVQRWRKLGIPAPQSEIPIEIFPRTWTAEERGAYSYLLGQYLGDGHITANHRTHTLTITCDGKYRGIIDSVARTIEVFSPRPAFRRQVKDSAAIRVGSTWKAWPLFFPQHGPGSKLDRKIELVEWQVEVVDEHPEAFLRGLIHSDGSRCMNTFKVMLKDGPKEYSYPRYFFTNYSADIQAIFCRTCDRLGIRWSRSNWRNISVSHRTSVALLDEFIGPKV